jgi:hypothetical protein
MVEGSCGTVGCMADEKEHRVILDRANRMLRQSKILRRLSEELLQESKDLRASTNELKRKGSKRHPRKK